MNKFLLFPLLTFTIILFSGNSSASQDIVKVNGNEIWLNPNEVTKMISPFPSDVAIQECVKNGYLKNVIPKSEVTKVETNEKFIYFLDKPMEEYSGISSLELNGNKLKIQINQYRSFNSYEAFTNKYVTKKYYEGSPVASAVAHTITFGLALLLEPKKGLQGAFGCTDEFISSREIDINRSEKQLSSTIWRKVSQTHSFNISGLDTLFDTDNPQDTKSFKQIGTTFEIDLTDKIKSSSIPSLIELEVFCKSCTFLTLKHQEVLGKAEVKSSITADFRYIKSQYDNQEKLRLKKITEDEDALAAKKRFIELQQNLKKK
jgi:hypothetical protein